MTELSYSSLPLNKYSRIYTRLIQDRLHAVHRKGLTEAHHVFPVCVFGENPIKVNLTHREHYISHLLLYRMYLQRYNPKQVYVKRLKKVLDYYRSNGCRNSREYSQGKSK